MKIIRSFIKPLIGDVIKKQAILGTAVNTHSGEIKVKMLQEENTRKQERIEVITSVLINLQSNLNVIDGAKGSRNIIIFGVLEQDIVVADDNNENLSISTDKEKIKTILKKVEFTYFNEEMIDNMQIERIGNPRPEFNRFIKVTLKSTEERNSFLKNTSKLKTLE